MNIISLFSGCGGMDLGLIKAGHKIVWANDIDKDSVETYKNYFSKKYEIDENHIHCDDIYNISINNIPDGDVVVGGFPCQGFSIANSYRNNQRDSEKNNNKLYLELLRIIKGKNPKYFIAENVKGITSLGGYENSDKKKKKEGRIMTRILKDMHNLKYHVTWKILNASSYGVPQNRERVIFLGTRMDLAKQNKILEHPPITHSIKPSLDLKTTPVLWDAIGDLEKIELGTDKIYNHNATSHKVKINGYMGNRETKKNLPSPTIVGRGGGTGGPVIIPHPNKKRRLSVRETARIQMFPDDMKFYGSNSSAYRQIGNAVPSLLAYNIGLMLNKL